MERTPQTFQNHLDKRVAACGTTHLLLSRETLLGTDFAIVPHSCSSNYCSKCRRSNLIAIRKALLRTIKHDRWRLVTLTFARRLPTLAEALTEVRRSFRAFARRLREHYPAVKYVRTIELHKANYPHIHMIVSQYVPKAFLQLQWKRAGGGFVDIRSRGTCKLCGQHPPCPHIKHPRKYTYRDAAKYLTEEIEKVSQDPYQAGVEMWCANMRSITLSRTLKLNDEVSEWQFSRMLWNDDDIDSYFAMLPTGNRWDLHPNATWTSRGSSAYILDT